MKLSDLKPDTANANRGTDRGRKMVTDSLRDLGAARSIVVDKHGNILAGNKTAAGWAALGFDDVIIVQTDGTKVVVVQRTDLDLKTDSKAKLLGLVDNRASEVGLEWDPKVIANLQGEITLADMFTPKELEAILKTMRGTAAGTDDAPAPPEDPETQAGDLYLLGDHRLLCGDSTRPEDVARLADGNVIDLCWMDPPYNVAYVGGGMTIQNDDQSDADFAAMLASAMLASASVLKDGAMCYVAHSDSYGHSFRRAALQAGFVQHACLVWVKSAFVMGRSDYHWQHEPILYLQKPGAPGGWHNNRKQTTVLEFDRPAKCDVHPTMKPIALVQYCVENSSAPGDKVVDLFGGSGTTMMACEATGRTAFLMELDRGYCDVIVKRWETATGRKAERIRG